MFVAVELDAGSSAQGTFAADIQMDFDLINHDTAVSAFNNVICTLVRAPAQ